MAVAQASEAEESDWETESYLPQKLNFWPPNGRHILAQYNEQAVVVYQAYNPEIAKYATDNQRFGGPKFSFTRMSWIKTNFLWMMYRCGWASKPGQERVLAVWISRDGFEEILSKAYTPESQNELGINKGEVMVRLQWDPDHKPDGSKTERRAIQLGLRGEILKKYATEWVMRIEDITPSVLHQARILKDRGEEQLVVAKERVYTVRERKTAELIGVDRTLHESWASWQKT